MTSDLKFMDQTKLCTYATMLLWTVLDRFETNGRKKEDNLRVLDLSASPQLQTKNKKKRKLAVHQGKAQGYPGKTPPVFCAN